ncbi:50S ribosomal protein L10 [Candidatus Saccharibacteria bacterium]|nr:50S ribosomal protein L10 [Candidatus Saccharibacteria bacterium]
MAKTREQKEADVKALSEAFDSCKIAVLTDYRGLDVPAISDLRGKLREGEVGYKVAKNTLVKIAVAGSQLKDVDTSIFTGPMAIAFGQDEAQTCKIIADFTKDNEALEILGAIDESGKTLSREEVLALAKLPSREVLIALTVGTIAAPLSGFARVLNANITQLLYALNAIQEKKGA